MAYWIEAASNNRLGTAARPRGGDWLDSEMSDLRREGVDLLVSLLTLEEEAELELLKEGEACTAAGIGFRRFSIPDRETPVSLDSFRQFLRELHQESLRGKSIVAHCRAGIGRSSLLIAALLTMDGHSADEAFQLISKARGLQVPDTPEQVEWLRSFSAKP